MLRNAPEASALQGVTHLVYAALYEAPNLVDGWRDEARSEPTI
jgi:hypothetical protein